MPKSKKKIGGSATYFFGTNSCKTKPIVKNVTKNIILEKLKKMD